MKAYGLKTYGTTGIGQKLVGLFDNHHFGDVARLTHPEARELAMAILALVDGQNPVKPKETPKKGPSDWVGKCAEEIEKLMFSGTMPCDDATCAMLAVERTIRTHARNAIETLNKDEELKKLNEENQQLQKTIMGCKDHDNAFEERIEYLTRLVEEHRHTIALLSQQLSDKKEVIRRLTT